MASLGPLTAVQQGLSDSVALSRIHSADLSGLQSILLTGKRCKRVHLFDHTGRSTLARSHAAFMVDGSMTPIELANWDMVQRWGVRVPTIYGRTDGSRLSNGCRNS